MKKLGHIIANNCLMLKYLFKFAPLYICWETFFCIYVSFVDTLSGAIALQFIFNGLSSGKSFKELFLFLIFVGTAMLLRHIFGAISEYLGQLGSTKITAGMRKVIFEKARSVDLKYYETPKFYTDFVWASSQADQKIGLFCRSWAFFVARLSDIFFVGAFMITTDSTLLIIVGIALVVRIISSVKRIKAKYAMDVKAKPLERKRDYITRVFYLADYAKEIRLSDMHKSLFSDLKKTMADIKSTYEKYGKKIALYHAVSTLVVDGALDFVMYFYLAYQALITRVFMLGDITALTNATYRITDSLKQFIDTVMEFGQHSLYIDNFKDFLAYEPKTECQPGKSVDGIIKEIELKNVSFKYEGEERYSLKNINLTLKPYEKIAIVGYNGAGKSTLAKLLMRFYDVEEGEILIGGENIKQFDSVQYRDQFGSVFQDYKIFAGTIAENVLLDRAEDDDKGRVLNSLIESGFGDKLKALPNGVDTQLTREFSKDGVNLSGGEEQKIAIARIFCKNCNYVILDEPSSALDPISEYKLNESMMHLSEHKTVIFISHRLSTTCMADRIIMLENGEIIEEGSHEALMSANGKYAEMFNKQAEKYRMV